MINIAICDDNADDLNLIVNMIEEILKECKIEFVLHKFLSAKKMIKEIKRLDIGILDISMDELNGIELGRKLKSKFTNVKLLYITSFREYCLQAINDVHAFSFLCKPIDKVLLKKQLYEVVNKDSLTSKTNYRIFNNMKDMNGKVFLTKKVNMDDIIYFEYIKSKRRIMMVQDEEQYEFPYVMDTLSKELEGSAFEISCRGCLINLKHVSRIKGYDIHLDNGKIVPLSQKRGAKFKIKLNEYLSNCN